MTLPFYFAANRRPVQKPRSDNIRFENRSEPRDQRGRLRAIELLYDRKDRNDDAFKSAEKSLSSLRARTESGVLNNVDRKEVDSN